ncbi:MAG: 4-hydroxythreonine-4-phosphate dehydrogenase PdxA [Spirochaetia bacterium]
MQPIIAITMGDPAGIGPEVVVKALAHPEPRTTARFLVVGDRRIVERAVALTGAGLEVVPVTDAAAVSDDSSILYLFDLDNVDHTAFEYGRLSAVCGRAAYEAIDTVISLAMDRLVDATVTAPINKEALRLAGIPFAGHTEIFADKTGTGDYAMMLVHDSLRVVHLSTHVSLREACDRVSRDRVTRVIHLAHVAVKRLGVATPRIAVAGLNPHAGENGLFGREEIEQIAPAVEAVRAEGIEVVGPLAPDTLFPMAAAGDYDCVVVMYHDQGHIPLKLLGFTYDRSAGFTDVQGVNITLGLPIIRTSVDHGTAFDKAGTGTASETSMVQAIHYATQLAHHRLEKE